MVFEKILYFLCGAKIPLMPGRYALLRNMIPAYQETGIPFLLKQSDGTFIAHTNADDMGLYVLVPKLMQWFDLSLDNALALFFHGISIGGLVIGLIGCWRLYKAYPQRLLAFAYLVLLTKVTTGAFDIYRIPAALAIGAIPWTLYFLTANRKQPSPWTYLFLFLLGIAAGTAHYIRSNAGMAVLFFACILLLAATYAWRQKLLGIGLLALGLALPCGYFMYQRHQYEQFISTHAPEHIGTQQFHGFWHPLLAGLGFLHNEFGIEYSDSNIVQKVTQRDASWKIEFSKEYEQAARALFMDIAHSSPWFIITTLGAKLGVLLLYLVIFANIGLLAAWYRPLPWRLLLAFLLAMGWNALPGLIAIPIASYIYGFIVFAGFLGLVSINNLQQSVEFA